MNEEKRTCIKDIYSGKPDARDESTLDNDSFLRSYVMPPNFNLDDLINTEKCLISGYKGTGKTALLIYLSNHFKRLDEATCNSFILFKTQFDNRKRDMWAKTMTVECEHLKNVPDFTAIWRWHLFQQFVEDNQRCNGQLFVEDEAWDEFVRLVLSMVDERPTKKRERIKPGKITFGVPLLGGVVTPQLDVSFEKEGGGTESWNFYDRIEEATEVFCDLTRTDVPYYVFLDELEAFYGEDDVFHRDLRLIRDLILEVKNLNMLIFQNGMAKTKLICAVRSEIINSINRFVESKELNKVTDGFDCPLIWDHNTTASFQHPIIEILLKRIEMAEQANGVEYASRKDLQARWFPELINGIEPVPYILNITWSKPRDIVRLIEEAKNGLYSDHEAFTQAVLESSIPKYSRKSLHELQEELRARYRDRGIDNIFGVLTGFVETFTVEKLRNHLQTQYPEHEELVMSALDDLYRLGIIGNIDKGRNRYRWHYRGEERFIRNDDWMITIHRGLRKALSTTEYKPEKKAEGPRERGADEFLMTNITEHPKGIQGEFDGKRGLLHDRYLGEYPVEMYEGSSMWVRMLDAEPVDGLYTLEPADGDVTPNCEVLLTDVVRTTNGGARGTIVMGDWQGEGTLSAKRWRNLHCSGELARIKSIRTRVIKYNQNGDNFELEPVEENAVEFHPTVQPAKAPAATAAAAPAASPACAPAAADQEDRLEELLGKIFVLQNAERTTKGGARGTFGDGLVGTISRPRMQAIGVNVPQCNGLRVMVKGRNVTGGSYNLVPVDENGRELTGEGEPTV